MRLLVTGASGLLGLHLASLAAERHTVTGVVHSHPLRGVPFRTIVMDLAEPTAVERLLDVVAPEAVVHTAALAYPEACEDQPELAERVNACLPGWLAAATARTGVPLLHVSTDAVYDGFSDGYREDSPVNPRNTYARSKLAGERAVQLANPQAAIVRTVFYGWSLNGKRSLAEWFFNNLAAGNPIRGFTDAFFCPLIVDDAARLILEMVERRLSGIYHVVSSEAISKYAFGVAIARLFGLDETLIAPASVAASGLRAPRSANLSLNCDKLSQALGVVPPGQMEGLRKFYQQHENGEADRVRRLGNPQPGDAGV